MGSDMELCFNRSMCQWSCRQTEYVRVRCFSPYPYFTHERFGSLAQEWKGYLLCSKRWTCSLNYFSGIWTYHRTCKILNPICVTKKLWNASIKAWHSMQSCDARKEVWIMDSKMKSRWVHCPICGGKTRTKVYEDTVLVKFPLYCPKCKREILIDVVKLKMVPSKEPDA